MRGAILLLLPLAFAKSFVPIRRQDTSPSPSFDSEFPSSTAIPGLPPCAQDCYSKARNQTSDCPDGSIACLCAQPEVQGFIASCLPASCATDDFESAALYGTEYCKAAVAAETASATASSAALTAAAPSASAQSQTSVFDGVSASEGDASQGTSDAVQPSGEVQSRQVGRDTAGSRAEDSSPPLVSGTSRFSSETAATAPTTLIGASAGSKTRTSGVLVTAATSQGSASKASAAAPTSSGAASPKGRAGLVGLLLVAGGIAVAI